MPQRISIKVHTSQLEDQQYILSLIAFKLKLNINKIGNVQKIKQSIDARKRPILFELQYIVNLKNEEPIDYFGFDPKLKDVTSGPEVYIAGCGPAGLFAALQLISSGLKPIIIERGKDVKSRRRDLALMNKEGKVNPESNYCYGEGGAGTYSDGKLYTRSGNRDQILNCLKWFHHFGADEKILYTAHPHIGTNKLPHIIATMRDQIIECGGEVLFDHKLTDIEIQFGAIKSITLNGSDKRKCDRLILATGHSARDIFKIMDQKSIWIEPKEFALGVRIEHPQQLINEIQYKCSSNDPILDILGAASYSLVSQENERGVFSFCMCPGGIIAPASTEEGALVVNGWSPSKRNGLFANSGMVVTVGKQDFMRYKFNGNLAAMHYQNMVENQAWQAGGGQLRAPAQKLTDFIRNVSSTTLPECSYLPGVSSANLNHVLPSEIALSLRNGFKSFGRKLKGFLTEEAIITATESRTSSPVKITRNPDTLQHIHVSGLYPCGEGAGYAGGIISAAMDGIRVASKVCEVFK